ncbi:MAG: kynureninase, partial [Chitinophagaceae bacterium]|nr:kynureninase [Chitinophagaceae bacterium]
VNLHLLMCTFYRPAKERYKILCEEKAFPSDQYAMESQVKWHGFNPEEAIVEVKALPGEYSLRTENILNAIYEHGNSLAMVLFGGVNYYTGQRFDIRAITKAAHEVGAFAGFDLAHAAGNVELKLHEWDVDFACWCSYKYLNSGPGGVAGIFIHERYATDAGMPRLAGWWGYDKSARFKMEKGFIPIPSAEGWQLSNAPILSMAAHRASLEIFREAGMQRLHEKRNMMSAYLLFLLKQLRQKYGDEVFTLITPEPEDEHGCQVSLLMHANGKKIFEELTASGVVADWREPDVIRIAPVPLYNTFEEIYQFRQLLEQSIQNSRTS